MKAPSKDWKEDVAADGHREDEAHRLAQVVEDAPPMRKKDSMSMQRKSLKFRRKNLLSLETEEPYIEK